jgi:hypothetical protein
MIRLILILVAGWWVAVAVHEGGHLIAGFFAMKALWPPMGFALKD